MCIIVICSKYIYNMQQYRMWSAPSRFRNMTKSRVALCGLHPILHRKKLYSNQAQANQRFAAPQMHKTLDDRTSNDWLKSTGYQCANDIWIILMMLNLQLNALMLYTSVEISRGQMVCSVQWICAQVLRDLQHHPASKSVSLPGLRQLCVEVHIAALWWAIWLFICGMYGDCVFLYMCIYIYIM